MPDKENYLRFKSKYSFPIQRQSKTQTVDIRVDNISYYQYDEKNSPDSKGKRFGMSFLWYIWFPQFASIS